MNIMGGHSIAGETGSVHQQYPVALAGQQHSGWGTGAADTNNNGIVHGNPPVSDFGLVVSSRFLEDIVPFILTQKGGQWAYLSPVGKADF
jgi:hypothetical protein